MAGQAMVPVLFIVMILTALAVTLTAAGTKETRAASSFLRDTQMYYTAMGAINFAAMELQQGTTDGATTPQLTPPADTDANGWTQLGDCWYKLDIIDTCSRVNINTADINTLAKLPPLQADPSIAAAIIDWRDADENVTNTSNAQGAESEYYQSLNPPYMAKNQPFDSTDELLLVRGVTPAMLYGQAALGLIPQNTGGIEMDSGMTRAASRQAAGGGASTAQQPAVDTSTSTMPLCEMVTTYSRELNVAADGTPRVNLKTATQNQLRNAGIAVNLARQITQNRGNNGANLRSVADLMAQPYTGFTRQVMQQIADKITVATGQYRDGVVNINTAPAEVLATIQGVDSTVYNAILQARQNGTVFNTLGDLFQIQNLSRTQFQALVDHVCTKSAVYLVRVRVRMTGTQRVYAAQALVDLGAAQANQTGTTGTGGATGGTTGTTQQGSTGQYVPKLLQFREVPRTPGWGSWLPGPNYYTTTTTVGGTLGNP